MTLRQEWLALNAAILLPAMLLGVFAGCSDHRKPTPGDTTIPNVLVTHYGSTHDVDTQRFATQAHLDAWQRYEGYPSRPFDLAVFDDQVEVGIAAGYGPVALAGAATVPRAGRPRIFVWIGVFGALDALYHELAHINEAPVDTQHLHPDWPQWDQRGDDTRRWIEDQL